MSLQKLKFSIKVFFSECDQIRSKLRIWSHIPNKSSMEKFSFCEVLSLFSQNFICWKGFCSNNNVLWGAMLDDVPKMPQKKSSETSFQDFLNINPSGCIGYTEVIQGVCMMYRMLFEHTFPEVFYVFRGHK